MVDWDEKRHKKCVKSLPQAVVCCDRWEQKQTFFGKNTNHTVKHGCDIRLWEKTTRKDGQILIVNEHG